MAADLQRCKRRVNEALNMVKKILERTRNPVFPTEQQHAYNDKYLLAEIAVNAAIVSNINALYVATEGKFGGDNFGTMFEWAKDSEVTMRYSTRTSCTFVRTATRKVESQTETVVESTGVFGGKTTMKNVTSITEHFWKMERKTSVHVYRGDGSSLPGEAITLLSSTGSFEVKTRGVHGSTDPPRPPPGINLSDFQQECSLSWLLRNVSESSSSAKSDKKGESVAPTKHDFVHNFSIDRNASSCHTPFRNDDVAEANKYFSGLERFTKAVSPQVRRIWNAELEVTAEKPDISAASTDSINGIFSAIYAVFCLEDRNIVSGTGSDPSEAVDPDSVSVVVDEASGLVVSVSDFHKFLEFHFKQLNSAAETIEEKFPAAGSGGVVTADLGRLLIGIGNCGGQAFDLRSALRAIEEMLRSQLISAIGKIVRPDDFAEYMDFHNRKLFKPDHCPKGFCYAVRRDECFPEGLISIESLKQGEKNNAPLRTSVLRDNSPKPMQFPISASANVTFHGDRFLHTCVVHQFSGGLGMPNLQLTARARQFSSFIVMVGKIVSKEIFDPTAALVVQNLDDLKIPLMLETIPTPQEFADAIESLSPEQQRFAKAFRSMQLSSTMFGVCVIQIKPQLEKVLNIPAGGLTKEIELTQNLMELFFKYQIPSDLLSFDEDLTEDNASPAEKKERAISAVKAHVAAIHGILEKAKEKELEAANAKMKKNVYEELSSANMSFGAADMMMEAAPKDLSASAGVFMKSARGRRGGGGLRQMMKKNVPSRAPAPRGRPAPTGAPVMAMASVAPTSAAPPNAAPVGGSQSKAPSKTASPQGSAQGGKPTAGHDHSGDSTDYTAIPGQLDDAFKALDVDSALRPTIIKMRDVWTRKAQDGLLSKPKDQTLRSSEQRSEKQKAFDLLDALSRSGVLSVDYASLHIVIAATHCFDKTLIDTVIQDNVNPIEKVERSILIMASTVKKEPVESLVKADQVERLRRFAPSLFSE